MPSHLLIVEQCTVQAELLRQEFTHRGFRVTLVGCPRAALANCQEEIFDLALINCYYPDGYSGFHLASVLRAKFWLRSLMLTANRARDLFGCQFYYAGQELLFKPYTLRACRHMVRRVLNSAPQEIAERPE